MKVTSNVTKVVLIRLGIYVFVNKARGGGGPKFFIKTLWCHNYMTVKFVYLWCHNYIIRNTNYKQPRYVKRAFISGHGLSAQPYLKQPCNVTLWWGPLCFFQKGKKACMVWFYSMSEHHFKRKQKDLTKFLSFLKGATTFSAMAITKMTFCKI